MARIYLATDEEITSVIEKLRDSKDKHVVLVVPKGAALLQSVINIRLLKKKADALGKIIELVTPDTVSKHLAEQVGLGVYTRIEDAPQHDKPRPPVTPVHAPVESRSEEPEHKGLVVKDYNKNAKAEVNDVATEEVVAEPTEAEAVSADSEIDEKESVSDGGDGDVIVGQAVSSADEEPPRHSKRLKPKRRPLKVPRWAWITVLVLIIVLILGGVAAAAAVPQMTIVLHVPTEPIKRTVTFTVDSNTQIVSDTTIPGTNVQATGQASADAKATGKKSVGNKAKGTITILNTWSTNPQTITKNTGFVTSGNMIFRALSDVTVPGESLTKINGKVVEVAGKIDVSVAADQPGDTYNIGSSHFAIQGLSSDQAANIVGQSSAPMSGGTTKDLVVVAQADIDQAKKDAKTKADEAATTALQQVVPTGQILLAKTITTTDKVKDPNHAVGDEADTVSVDGSANIAGVTFRTDQLNGVLNGIFAAGLAATKSVILPDLNSVDWAVSDKGNGRFELSKELEGQIITTIDTAAVKRFVAFRKSSGLEDSLKTTYGASAVEVSTNPSWWPMAPLIPSRVHVQTMQ